MNKIMQLTVRSTSIIRSLRCISSCSNLCKQNEEKTQNFVPVYKFPYIRALSLVNRLKVYQTALAATSIPGAVVLNYLNYISSDTVQFLAALGVSGCLSVYSFGYLTTKFIGFIYYDEKNDLVKVSYIDFWGRRKDIVIPAGDVVPISEMPFKFLDGLFLSFSRFSTKETLKLNLRFGIVLDKEKIKKIL